MPSRDHALLFRLSVQIESFNCEKHRRAMRRSKEKRHKTTTTKKTTRLITRYNNNNGETNEIGEKSRQEIEQRVGASSSSSFVFLFGIPHEKREGEFQSPNWGNTFPSEEWVWNSLPRAFGRAIVVQESDDDVASLFSSKLALLTPFRRRRPRKKNRNPLDRDSARPRVKATKSGPNRKRMRSPPG